jgi:Calpain family cysteine protease
VPTTLNGPYYSNGQHFNEPWPTSSDDGIVANPHYVDYSANPLFSPNNGPTIDDVQQTESGDCYLMAAIAGAAKSDPNYIRSIIVDFGDGTYGVKLAGNYYRIDGQLPVETDSSGNNNLDYAQLGAENSLWVALLEKADTFSVNGATSAAAPNYQAINGGHPLVGLQTIGLSSCTYQTSFSNATQLFNWIEGNFDSNRVVTVATDGHPDGLIGNHVYTVTGIDPITQIVTLRNPWGRPTTEDTNGPSHTVSASLLLADLGSEVAAGTA